MNDPSRNTKNGLLPFYTSLCGLTVLVLIEVIYILLKNDFNFVYTLDDAYIHLALADKLSLGHYGINLNEYSSPSSSILWPYLLAPFSQYPGDLFPLIINIAAAILTLFSFFKVLDHGLLINDRAVKNAALTVILMAVMLVTNMTGLIFTGMEHSLQQLFAVLIFYGIVRVNGSNKIPVFLIISIIISPLIRYDSMALCVPALLFLYIKGYKRTAVISLMIIIFILGIFSLYLSKMGLPLLPASVLAKGPEWNFLMDSKNVYEYYFVKFRDYKVTVHLLLTSFMIVYAVRHLRRKDEILLAGTAALALLLLIFFGRYGWYYRYEIFVWSFLLLSMIYVFRDVISDKLKSWPLLKVMLVTAALITVPGFSYLRGLMTIPIASNNIYQQQYQMGRFVKEYYKKPAAVNDLGLVSYRNYEYVLDLAGLANYEALKLRKKIENSTWIGPFTEKKGVKLIMIYEEGFPEIPDTWIKLGELHLGDRKITPEYSNVAFFAADIKEAKEITNKLTEFQKTLPTGVRFSFTRKALGS